jgi:rubrerythrin
MGVLSRLFGGGRERELLTDVVQAYRAERQQAELLRQNAERAKYPQAADAMRRLAEEETRHAEHLRRHLHVLGGDLPTVEPLVIAGNSQWERIVAAYEAAQAKRRRLIELISHWDPDEPEFAALLRTIADEDQREFRVYEAVIMRSDPQAID